MFMNRLTVRAASAVLALAIAFAGSSTAADNPGAGARSTRPARLKLVQAVYPIGDLVVLTDAAQPITSLSSGSKETMPGTGAPARGAPRQQAVGPSAATQLIELITGVIEPRTWSKQGGPASIEYHPLEMALAVRQTPDIQEQVQDLLIALRKLQEINVVVEVRILQLPPGFLDDLDLAGSRGAKRAKAPKSSPRAEGQDRSDGPELPAFLNGRHVRRLLDTVRGDRHAEILHSARLMVAVGQVGSIGLNDQRSFPTQVTTTRKGEQPAGRPRAEILSTGFRLSVQPVASADRRFVRLSLAFELADVVPGPAPQSPGTATTAAEKEGKTLPAPQQAPETRAASVALQGSLTIPDGGTVLLGGWSRPGGGRESETILLMVTPRIIIPEEEEARQVHQSTGKASPK